MHIKILTIGKTGAEFAKQGAIHYFKRAAKYAPVELVELPDVKKRNKLNPEQLKVEEGIKILQALTAHSELYLLDERGKSLTSVQFSQFLQTKMNSGIKTLYLVIGGAYGFSDEVYAKANGKIRLSSLTFPHDLIRVFIAEQVYRAFTILKGEPYHHD